MEWLPLIGGVANFFGNLFGFGNGSTTQTTSQNENSSTNTTTGQTTTAEQQDTQVGTQNQQQNQTSAQQTGTTATGSQTGKVSRLDQETENMLRTNVQELLGAGGSSGTIKARLNEVATGGSNFDEDSFVRGIMGSARSAAMGELESGGNAIEQDTGAGADSNSAAALLKTKMRNQVAANLGGIEQQARGQAEEIKRAGAESKTGQLTALSGQLDSSVNGLLSSLLSASQTEERTDAESSAATTSGNTATTTNQQTNQTNTSKQKNATAGTQQSNTTGTVNQASQKTEWDKFWSGVGDIFSAQW